MSTNKLPNISSLSKIAESIYDDIPDVIKEENSGRFIAIELHSKEYFIGESKDEAVQHARKKYPDELMFIRRIGSVEKIQKLSKKTSLKTFSIKRRAYAGIL